MVSRASKRPEGGESGEQTIQRPRGLEGTCEGQPRSFGVPDVGNGRERRGLALPAPAGKGGVVFRS